MGNYKTLYYSVRCKIYIKAAKTYRVLNRKRLRLDYETDKKIIQDIEVLSLFTGEINIICSQYNTDISNIVIKEITFQQIENIDDFIEFTVIDDRLVVHTLEEETYTDKTEYLIEVLNSAIKIVISNYNPKYIYQFNCEGSTGNFDIDTYYYVYSKPIFTFTITTYYQDKVINTIEKELTLNDTSTNVPSINNKNYKQNIHTNQLNLFQTGIEYTDKKPYLTNSSKNEPFDMIANIKGLTDTSRTIYPKVTTSYDINCSYNHLIDKIYGAFSYTATLDYDGYIKAKIIKLAVDPIKVTYDINCKVTFFETQGTGYKTWVTKDVTLSRECTFDLYDDFFITDTVNYDDSSLVKRPDSLSVYNLMNDKAKSLYSLGNNYTLHSYKITNIKNYLNNSLITSSNSEFVTPVFYSSEDMDASKPIKYIISPNYVYSDEKTVEMFVNKTPVTVVNDASFNFPITNSAGSVYTGSRYKYNIYILDTNIYTKYSISNKTLTAWSTYSTSISNSYEFNDSFSSITINLGKEAKVAVIGGATANVTVSIKCLKDSIYINGTTYAAGATKVLTMEGEPSSLFFGVTGTVKKVTESITLRLPENKDEIFRASINGNESTYMTDLRGKDNYVQKEEPFIIPPDATNVTYKINIFNTIPKEAVVTHSITQTNNPLTHSMVLSLSSNYTQNISVSSYSLLDTQTFSNYILIDGNIKDFTLQVQKPSVSKPAYQLYLESTNPNILLEYNKALTFVNNTATVTVKCYATKHPACKWQLMIPSSYCYYGEDEYFMYNKKIIATPIENKVHIGRKITSTNPICIMNEFITLSKIISTEDDGITIKEVLNSDDNYFFTSYKNINITKVTNQYDEEIPFTQYNHYFYAKSSECVVYYTVSNSFDYNVSESGTYITINTEHNGSIDIYYNDEEYLLSGVSLNPIHTNLDSGCIFLSEQDEKISKHKIYYSNYEDIHCYYIELLDKYNNPVTLSISPAINNIAAGTTLLSMTKENTSGVISLRLKSSTNVRTETILIDDYEIKL